MKADPVARERAQNMRPALTNAETILWSRLKGRRLGYQFRRQHPIGPYIADFACARQRLVVEVDGETHSTEAERRHDKRRTLFIEAEGWSVIRFWNFEIYNELDAVLSAITDRLPPPSR